MEAIADEFIQKFADVIKMKVGDPMDPATNSPLSSEAAAVHLADQNVPLMKVKSYWVVNVQIVKVPLWNHHTYRFEAWYCC
jgi:hypothetical protein